MPGSANSVNYRNRKNIMKELEITTCNYGRFTILRTKRWYDQKQLSKLEIVNAFLKLSHERQICNGSEINFVSKDQRSELEIVACPLVVAGDKELRHDGREPLQLLQVLLLPADPDAPLVNVLQRLDRVYYFNALWNLIHGLSCSPSKRTPSPRQGLLFQLL